MLGNLVLKEFGVKLPRPLTDFIVENCGGLVLAFLAHFPRNKMASDRQLAGNSAVASAVIPTQERSGLCLWSLFI